MFTLYKDQEELKVEGYWRRLLFEWQGGIGTAHEDM